MATDDQIEALENAMIDAALGPKSITHGDKTIVQRDTRDIKDAIDEVKRGEAAGKAHFGLRFSRLVPPAAG